jgi:GH35 family endo-1,4-beta-xylanase
MNLKILACSVVFYFSLGCRGYAQTGLKDIILPDKDKHFLIGSAFDSHQLNTEDEKLLLREFNMMVPENSAKQSVVHPRPGVWRWERIDSLIVLAKKNNLLVRVHGPIGPQCSKWVKADERTAEELSLILDEFMIEQCRRFNGNNVIRFMDVVNETVTPAGDWFGPKQGNDLWENPWTKLGNESDNNRTPSYIIRAFQIAGKNAPNIGLIYNQHGGMEPPMWNRVKETILLLRSRGLRVDGIGWQAHLSPQKSNALDDKGLKYLESLIDWCHANNLGFHVTEIDYKLDGVVNDEALNAQANAYGSILETLLSRKGNGLVTFSTWGIRDRATDKTNRFMFDAGSKPKPAYFFVKKILSEHQTKSNK